MSPSPSLADIVEQLRPLVTPGRAYELRALAVGGLTVYRQRSGDWAPLTYSGLFAANDLTGIAHQVHALSGHCAGIYFAPNSIGSADRITGLDGRPGWCLTRARTGERLVYTQADRLRMTRAYSTTRDIDIPQRERLAFDFDPPRAAGHERDPATAAEREVAWTNLQRALAEQQAAGWPAPTIQDSGNGYYLWYHLDPFLVVAADDLIERVLIAAGADTACAPPSHVMRLPGGLNRKGTPSADRPWRHSRIIQVGSPERVTREQLAHYAAHVAPTARTRATARTVPVSLSAGVGGCTALTPRIRARAERLIDRIPDGIQGQGGQSSRSLIWLCQSLLRGLLLSPADTLDLIDTSYNPRCRPAWSRSEIAHKIQQALTHPVSKPAGWLLEAPAPKQRSAPQTITEPCPAEWRLLARLGAAPTAETAPTTLECAPSQPASGDNGPDSVGSINGGGGRYCSDCDTYTCSAVGPEGRCGHPSPGIPIVDHFPIGIPGDGSATAAPPAVLAIVGQRPIYRRCRHAQTLYREGVHATTVGQMDLATKVCGRCVPCQEQIRYSEKLRHVTAALRVGTHIVHEADAAHWERIRKRIQHLRKKHNHNGPFPFARCIAADGRRLVVLGLDIDPALVPADWGLAPASGEQCATLMSGAIDGIPWRLPKGTRRIPHSPAWAAVTGGPAAALPEKPTERLYTDYVPVPLATGGADLETVAQTAREHDADVRSARLPARRIAERIIITPRPGTERAVFAAICGASLIDVRLAIRAKQEARRRGAVSPEERRQRRRLIAEAASAIRDLRERYRGREHDASEVIRLLIA